MISLKCWLIPSKGRRPPRSSSESVPWPCCRIFLKGRDSPSPCSEEEVYGFLKCLQKDEAFLSRISSVLEALNFTMHVVGVSELEGACESRRCKGLGVTECFTEGKQAPR